MPKYSAYIRRGRTAYVYPDAFTEDYQACLSDAARLLIESDWWEVKNGRVAVSWQVPPEMSPGNEAFWVSADSIQITGHYLGDVWCHLTKKAWQQGPWHLNPDDFWVKVSSGDRTLLEGDDQEKFESLLKSAKLPKALRSAFDSYTYISLELGRPIHKPVHATIAYAACMTAGQRSALKERLQKLLFTYLRTAPRDRPDVLGDWLYRKFKVGPRNDNSGLEVKTCAITSFRMDKVEHLIEQNMIVPRCCAPTIEADPVALEEYIWRLYDRDTERLQCARARAAIIESRDAAHMWALTDCMNFGLGGDQNNLALKDLLQYISDAVWYHSNAWYTVHVEKRLPPLVLDQTSWHVSQRDDWMQFYTLVD